MFKYMFVPAKFLPEGVGFSLYGTEHLIWLTVLTVMVVWMIASYRRKDAKDRQTMAKWFAYGLLVMEVAEDAMYILTGGWEWTYLPLHPCSFTMFFMAMWAYKPNRVLGNLMYGYGLAGALCALLFCNWTKQPIWQFQTICSFVFHGVLVGWILMTIIGGDIRPDGRGFLESTIFLAIAAPLTAIVNNTLPGCNFFFTYAGSDGSPLAFLIKVMGQPWWLLGYVALVLLVLALEFLPWYLLDKKRKAVAIEEAA